MSGGLVGRVEQLLAEVEHEIGCYLHETEGWYVDSCRERKLKLKCRRCLLVARLERALVKGEK